MSRSSVQRALPPMEVIAVDHGRSTTVNQDNRSRDWLALVARALGRSGIAHKAAALDMGIDAGLLSAQLSATSGKHLSWLRLGSLPPAFWYELVLLIVDFHQLTLAGTEQDRRDLELGRAMREALQRGLAR